MKRTFDAFWHQTEIKVRVERRDVIVELITVAFVRSFCSVPDRPIFLPAMACTNQLAPEAAPKRKAMVITKVQTRWADEEEEPETWSDGGGGGRVKTGGGGGGLRRRY